MRPLVLPHASLASGSPSGFSRCRRGGSSAEEHAPGSRGQERGGAPGTRWGGSAPTWLLPRTCGAAPLWAGDGAGMQQPPLTEAFGIFCHHRCRSIGSEAREGVPRILINLFSDIFSSLDWIFFSMHTLPSKEEGVGIAPRSPKRSHGVGCVCWGDQEQFIFLSRPNSALAQPDCEGI